MTARDVLYGRRAGRWAPAQTAEEAMEELRPILHPELTFTDPNQPSLFDPIEDLTTSTVTSFDPDEPEREVAELLSAVVSWQEHWSAVLTNAEALLEELLAMPAVAWGTASEERSKTLDMASEVGRQFLVAVDELACEFDDRGLL